MAALSSTDLFTYFWRSLFRGLVYLKGTALDDVFTALVRPLQASTHDGTAL